MADAVRSESRHKPGQQGHPPSDIPADPPCEDWKARFLSALTQGWPVTHAARAVAINPSQAYRARRKDAGFAAAWDKALGRTGTPKSAQGKGRAKANRTGKRPKPARAKIPCPGGQTGETPPAPAASRRQIPGPAAARRATLPDFSEQPVHLVLRVYHEPEGGSPVQGAPRARAPVARGAAKIRRSDKVAEARAAATALDDTPSNRVLTDDERAHRISQLLDAARTRRAGPAASE